MSRRSEQLSLFAALSAQNVEYAVVGGVAVNAHGFIRNTNDLDVFIRPTVDNAAATFRALTALNVPLSGLDHTDLLIDYAHFQLKTEDIRVDFLTSIGEMSFDQVWSNRVEEEIDGIRVQFISRQDLIANKLQVGRLLDLADAEQLALLPEPLKLTLAPEPAPDS
jgi:predicted nucleotidyltransferase